MIFDWGLNPGPLARDAGTLPLGYRGGRYVSMNLYYILEFTKTFTVPANNSKKEVPCCKKYRVLKSLFNMKPC